MNKVQVVQNFLCGVDLYLFICVFICTTPLHIKPDVEHPSLFAESNSSKSRISACYVYVTMQRLAKALKLK